MLRWVCIFIVVSPTLFIVIFDNTSMIDACFVGRLGGDDRRDRVADHCASFHDLHDRLGWTGKRYRHFFYLSDEKNPQQLPKGALLGEIIFMCNSLQTAVCRIIVRFLRVGIPCSNTNQPEVYKKPNYRMKWSDGRLFYFYSFLFFIDLKIWHS